MSREKKCRYSRTIGKETKLERRNKIYRNRNGGSGYVFQGVYLPEKGERLDDS